MALPTLDKTWQHDLNNFFAADNTPAGNAFITRQEIIFQVIQSLTGFASSPWTHVASSDSVTTSTVSNLILSRANVVWGVGGGSNRSWIVLRQTGLSSNFEILLDFQETSGENGSRFFFSVAPDGFDLSGISISNPPSTSLGQHGVVSSETQYGGGENSSTILDTVVNVQMSDDGEVTRINVRRNNIPAAAWRIEAIKNSAANMSMPVVWTPLFAVQDSPLTPALTVARFYIGANLNFLQMINGIPYLATEVHQSMDQVGTNSLSETMIGTNAFDGDEELYEAGLVSLDNATEGVMGDVYDLWWVPDTGSGNDADLYPADGSRQFMRFEHMVLPWDGSVPVLA